jgi:hypothetical protein
MIRPAKTSPRIAPNLPFVATSEEDVTDGKRGGATG